MPKLATAVATLVLAPTLGLALGLGATHAAAAPPARATCSAASDAASLVPDGAKAILQIDGKKATRSPMYRELRTALDRDLELKDGLAVLDACGLGLEDVDTFTAAVGPNDETVAIVHAKGIGSTKTLDCLRGRLASRKDGHAPWTTRREGCYRVLADDGKDFAFVLDDSTIVLTPDGWTEAVRERLQGKGSSAATTGSAGSLAAIDRSKTMWFTMALSDRDRTMLQGSAAADLEAVAGAIDFARGLDVTARLQLVDPGAAIQMRDELTMYRDLVDGMGALPQGMAKRVQLDARGPGVDVSLSLSAAELELLRKALEPHTRGKNPL